MSQTATVTQESPHTQDSPDSYNAASSSEQNDSTLADSTLNSAGNLPKGDVDENGNPVQYPSNTMAFLTIFSLCLAVFLYALDQTIISTAIPTIAAEFNSASDIGWYGSAYLLTSCAFQLAFGQFYRLFALKHVYITAFLIFELGSLLCGVAPNSTAFIVGRAIAGLGCAGIFSGSFLVLQYTVPLQKRAGFAGLFGATFALASISGPLIGGAFTRHVTWRWCFYMNLPLGALVIAVILFVVKTPAPSALQVDQSFMSRVKQIDYLGLITFLPAVVSLLLALQWGGSVYPWSDGRVIATLTVFAVLTLAFVASQLWAGERAMVPGSILKKSRSVACGGMYTFCLSAAFLMITYYLPLWFQIVREVSPVQSGINTLPVIIGFAVAALFAGAAVSGIGYFCPPMLLGAVLASVGAGLMSTFEPSSNHSHWIGYTALFGLGIGTGIQQPEVAVQVVLDRSEVALGFALMAFAQSMGGAVFVSVAQNVFRQALEQNGIGGSSSSATDPHALGSESGKLIDSVPEGEQAEAKQDYNDALARVFMVAAIMAALSFLFAAGMEWKSVKAGKGEEKEEDGAEDGEKTERTNGDSGEKDDGEKSDDHLVGGTPARDEMAKRSAGENDAVRTQ